MVNYNFVYVDNPHLQRIFVTGKPLCATIEEFASHTDISPANVLELVSDFKNAASIKIETTLSGDSFLLTAPFGRPIAPPSPDVAVNLWELFRRPKTPTEASVEISAKIWRLYRAMEKRGWVVDPLRISGLSTTVPAEFHPRFGLYWNSFLIPVLADTPPSYIADPNGVLSSLVQRGIGIAAITCAEGKLDDLTTATRHWLLKSGASANFILAEAPLFTPLLLSHMDGSLTPQSIATRLV